MLKLFFFRNSARKLSDLVSDEIKRKTCVCNGHFAKLKNILWPLYFG